MYVGAAVVPTSLVYDSRIAERNVTDASAQTLLAWHGTEADIIGADGVALKLSLRPVTGFAGPTVVTAPRRGFTLTASTNALEMGQAYDVTNASGVVAFTTAQGSLRPQSGQFVLWSNGTNGAVRLLADWSAQSMYLQYRTSSAAAFVTAVSVYAPTDATGVRLFTVAWTVDKTNGAWLQVRRKSGGASEARIAQSATGTVAAGSYGSGKHQLHAASVWTVHELQLHYPAKSAAELTALAAQVDTKWTALDCYVFRIYEPTWNNLLLHVAAIDVYAGATRLKIVGGAVVPLGYANTDWNAMTDDNVNTHSHTDVPADGLQYVELWVPVAAYTRVVVTNRPGSDVDFRIRGKTLQVRRPNGTAQDLYAFTTTQAVYDIALPANVL